MDYVFNARRETPRKPDANPELPPTPSKPQAMTSQDNTKASTGGFFSAINNQIQEKKIADKAAYSSLSALKIIGHVLGGLLHHSANMTEDQIEQQSQRMLKHYANQSKALLEKLKLPDERFVYESITGSMSKIISQHYRIAGDKALETDWAKLLNDVAELDGVWAEPKQSDSYGSPEVRRSMMMMNALAPLVSAYQKWNYLHNDPKPVLERMGDLLWSSVDEAISSSDIIQKMSADEQEMLRKNLLLRAGDLLADSWNSLTRETLIELREMATDERRYISANGYPLDKIENTFLSQFHLLRQTLSISLAVHSGMKDSGLSPDEPSASSPALG